MLTVSLLFIICCITGCSHSYDIRGEHYHLYDVNRWISNKDVVIVFTNGDSAAAWNVRLTVDTTFWVMQASKERRAVLTSKIHKIIFINHQQGFIEGFLLGCASGVGLGLLSASFGGRIDESGISNPILRFIVVGSGTAIISTVIGINNGSREEFIINQLSVIPNKTATE